MIGKVVASVVSVLLVVGIAIGVVAVVNNNKEESVSPQMKAVRSICEPATDQAACVKTLANVKSEEPQDLIKELVVATSAAVKTAYNFTEETLTKIEEDKNGTKKAALDYCMRVLDYALMDLQSFMDTVDGGVQNISDKYYYLKQWLVSTWVYQSDCLSDILDEDLEKTMNDGTSNARTLTSNAIDVVDKLSDVFSKFGIKLNTTDITEALEGMGASAPSDSSVTARRLLGDIHGGFPRWLSAGDRKLLAKARPGGGGGGVKPTHVVALDGSGQFKSVQAAVNACPEKNPGRCIIYIKAGLYKEQVIIAKKTNNIFMYGDGATRTVITFNRSVMLSKGTTTSTSGTVQVESDGFMAKWIGFTNTAGPQGHQAVALRINGDHAVVFDCRMDGYQDTLYVDSGHQFYRNIAVSGTVDFIFGTSACVIQNSLIITRRGNPGQYNTVTADGTEKLGTGTGIIIQNCRIVPDRMLAAAKLEVKSYLGRPWKQQSTTVVMKSEIGDFISPAGWQIWETSPGFINTCFYREFANTGPGANTNMRVKWKGYKTVTNPAELQQFTLQNFVLKPVDWLRGTGIPMTPGL